uniref:Protein disulfide isomerase-like n=1 Tax=Karlodinium veneficum TaxID=407301 RepID=E8Z6Z0_KARVE|nr:protein disulfide isomerase-like [Karlodinium veneficum]|mmetsp:Transcript_112384/g.177687  ORF Transcript_112384/g.177687 Transcript_112384/m.177687 type:complete len:220 (-) Transcript_112384:1-660(-)
MRLRRCRFISFVFFTLLWEVRLELTRETWDDAVEGKKVFARFYSAWCSHSQAMRLSWEKLAEAFRDDAKLLIADVNCTGAGKELCDDMGVYSYPTMLYGDWHDLVDYEGGRSYEILKEFADALGPPCSPAAVQHCNQQTRSLIANYTEMGLPILEEFILQKEAAIEQADAEYKVSLQQLEQAHNDLMSRKRAALDKLADFKFRAMKAVRDSRKLKHSGD